MTGLRMQNMHLRSTNYGEAWIFVSSDDFRTCMNGVTGEAETALPNGTLLRGLWGKYLPYEDVPQDGYMERSEDGGRTWSGPERINRDDDYMFWPKHIRMLHEPRSGRALSWM